jgi:hypothetical protein
LLVPDVFDLLGYLDDEITVATTSSSLREGEDRLLLQGESMPYYELARICSSGACGNFSYLKDGVAINSNGDREREWFASRPVLHRKFIRFPKEASKGGCYW